MQFNDADGVALLPEDDWDKYDLVIEWKADKADIDAGIPEEGITFLQTINVGDTSKDTNKKWAVEGATEYTYVYNIKDVNTQATANEDGKIYFGANIQNGHVAKAKVAVYFAEKGTVKESNNAPAAPATPDNSGSGDNSGSDNVNTGVEGVAAVVGVAALAGAALVVARKRK